MTSKSLILLLGHENTLNKLSPVASSRCDGAIELLGRIPNSIILPTGTFGKFNKGGNEPHWSYLADYLRKKGIPDTQILSGTDSTNTFEDCLCARKVILDGGFTDVHVVTSDYHVARVKIILGNIFRDIGVDVHKVSTPSECAVDEDRKERRSRKQLVSDWLTPPLYQVDTRLPELIYEATANDQRHYDTVSIASVTAIVVVSAFPFVSDVVVFPGKWNAILFAVAAFINFALAIIYERAALTARTARRVLRAVELGFGMRGFSANYNPKWQFPRHLPTIRIAASGLILVFFISLVAKAVWVWLAP